MKNKQPLNKPASKQTIENKPIENKIQPPNPNQPVSNPPASSQPAPVAKKQNILIRIILFPFKWVLKKVAAFLITLLIIGGVLYFLRDKIPNLIMALFTPNLTVKHTEEIPPSDEQIIYMQFDGKKMELDGNECRRPGDLPPLVNSIRQKYKDKNIIIIYKNTPDDPYELSTDFVAALKSHNFTVTYYTDFSKTDSTPTVDKKN